MTGKRGNSPKTAVIYARFSCSKQREASIDDQLRVCNDYCQREGIEVVGVYADYAMSGRTDDRPQFQKMIANAPESDYVVVYMMERFSRAKYDPAIYKKQIDQEDFADFLQFGATLSDADLLDAFVYQVMVFDDQCVVTLNYETEKCEPARLVLSRVRTESTWCPVCKNTRTMITVVNGAVYLMLPRAA